MDVRAAAVEVLRAAEREKRFVDEAIEAPRAALDPRDRKLLTAIVFGATRHRLTLDWLADRHARHVDDDVRAIFRVALFQMLFLDRVPDYAAVDAAVEQAKPLRRGGFVNAVLRAVQRETKDGLDAILPEDRLQRLSIAHSHPQWLVARWLKRFGTKTESILRANNAVLPVTARVGGALVEVEGDVTAHPAWPKLAVQDATSFAVAPLLDPKPGERLLDLCAAPGGKATHLAELMGDRGEVVALDLDPARLALVAEAAKRLGLGCITCVAGDGTAPPVKGPFDAVLVDAPCSNTGVLARRPDARWRLRPKDIAVCAALQRRLVDAAKALGRRVVYSTCSLEPEENDEIAPGGRLTLPTERAAGGYAARIMP
jgi:16S rRNA (cytosine967-C5)-methyltransferase